jgi:hypothetical protein
LKLIVIHSYLVIEGRAGQPKMMSVGLHCRLSRPARVSVLAEFVDYAKSYGREVWITTREAIATHWHENHLPIGIGSPITSAGAAMDSVNGKDSKDDVRTPEKSSSPSKRYGFLGNLKAPRDSEEYKQSLKRDKSKSESGDEAEEEEPDVI